VEEKEQRYGCPTVNLEDTHNALLDQYLILFYLTGTFQLSQKLARVLQLIMYPTL